MEGVIVIAWIIFLVVLLLVFAAAFFLVRHYSRPLEKRRVLTICTTYTVCLSLVALFLIPVDIFLVSHETSSEWFGFLKYAYYVVYCAILLQSFFVIPFCYFFFDEEGEDVTVRVRLWRAAKYAVFLLLFIILLFVFGLFLKESGPEENESKKDYIKHVFSDQNAVESAIQFAFGCLTLISYVCWVTYTAYGLSAFPIDMTKGKRHLDEERNDVLVELNQVKDKIRSIQDVRGTRLSSLNDKDRKEMTKLMAEQRNLERKRETLDAKATGFSRVMEMLQPFQLVFGLMFILLTVFIAVCMVLTLIDRAAHSWCGAKCGFILQYPQIINPLDTLMVITSKYFPLDLVVFTLIIIFIFYSTLYGITKIGIRFFWIQLYKIYPQRTQPQGLLLASVILLLSLLSLNVELSTLAPNYISFGSQTWEKNGERIPCNEDGVPAHCTITHIGTLISRLSLKMGFFGMYFYIATWVFLFAWLGGLIYSIIRRKGSNIEELLTDEDDIDNDENDLL